VAIPFKAQAKRVAEEIKAEIDPNGFYCGYMNTSCFSNCMMLSDAFVVPILRPVIVSLNEK
jgi:hypothetical protein